MAQFLLSNFGRGFLAGAIDAEDLLIPVGTEVLSKLPAPGDGEAFALTLWDGTHPEEIIYVTEVMESGTLVASRGEEGTTARAWLAGTEFRNALTAETAGAILQDGFIENNRASEQEAIEGASNEVLATPLAMTRHFNSRTTPFTRTFLASSDAVAARRELGWATATFSGTGLETNFTLPDTNWGTPYTKVYVDEVYTDSGYTIVADQLIFDEPPAAGIDNILVVLGINFAFSVSFPGANTVSEDALVDGAVTSSKLGSSAVTTAKINNTAVTYGKIQNVSASDKVLGRSTAGAGSVEEITFTSTARTLAAQSSVAGMQGVLTSTAWPVPTGTLWLGLAAAAPAGYIDCLGTVGSGSSGATYANANGEALFTLIWTVTSTVDCPLYDNVGSPVSKGVSAAADWAANRRIALPDVLGKFIRVMNVGGSGSDPVSDRRLASSQDDDFEEHNHSATTGEAGSHSHGLTRPTRRGSFGDVTSQSGWDGGDTLIESSRTHNTNSAGTHTHSVTVGNAGGASETRPVNVAFRACIKL